MKATRACTVDGCQGRHKGHGYCEKHLDRLKRTGTTADPVKSLAERFWPKVDKNGPILDVTLGPCWLWTAATNEHGYGIIRPEGRRNGPALKAHRVSLMLSGVDPEGFVVRHRCDNPPCVNPAHLRRGTQPDNVADAVTRGRHIRGERSGKAKLTDAQVAEIRVALAAGEQGKALAAHYGVTPPTITRIKNGEGWRHVA